MNTPILTAPMMICNFITILPEESINASTRDYGFDFDDEELAIELLTPLTTGLTDQIIPAVNTDDFEKLYQHFYS